MAITVTDRSDYGPGVNVNAHHLEDLCAGDRPALVAALAGCTGVEDSTPLGLARGPVPLLLLASELIPILDPHRIDLQRPRRGRTAVGTNLS